MKKSKSGRTPFYEAVESGDLGVVSLMLDAGANVNDRDNEGIPAIVAAAALGHGGVVKELIKLNADVNILGPQDFTCLHEAVIEDRIDIVHLLLDNSANIDAQNQDGWTALGLAIAFKAKATAKLLIS